MRTIVDRIGCKLNGFNADGICKRDNYRRLPPKTTTPAALAAGVDFLT